MYPKRQASLFLSFGTGIKGGVRPFAGQPVIVKSYSCKYYLSVVIFINSQPKIKADYAGLSIDGKLLKKIIRRV
jgi:hypothetical protein